MEKTKNESHHHHHIRYDRYRERDGPRYASVNTCIAEPGAGAASFGRIVNSGNTMTDKSITSRVCRISEKYRPVCEDSVGTEERNTPTTRLYISCL